MERLCKILIVSTTLFFLMVFICSCAQTETVPNAEQGENTLETTTSTTAKETEIPVETTPNNWYVEGYVESHKVKDTKLYLHYNSIA